MSDDTLSTLMGNVPSRSVDSPKVNERKLCVSQTPSSYSYRCILVLEDLDAAFARDISRDSTSTGAPTVPTSAAAEANDGSTLSLSGLLNNLEGVAAAEGR
jgi:chaperone BCS1